MAAAKVEVVFLHCDQGMGTLVRIYDSIGRLTHLVLVDLGSEAKTMRYADLAISTVVRALAQMEKDVQRRRIEMIVVSHQDYDHWSLFPVLLERLKASPQKTEVGAIYYGGARWRKEASESLRKWTAYSGAAISPFPRAHSDYDKPGKLGKLVAFEGVTFRVLAANAPCSRSANDLIRNGTSGVMVVDFADVRVVLPGDATADTIGFINGFFANWANAGKAVPVRPCRALGVPHHGSLRTIASNFTTANPKLDVARAFADYVAAENIVASAGYESQFYHPYETVMVVMSPQVKTDRPKHDFVVWEDSKGTWKQVPKSRLGIYTTIVTLSDPPKRNNWVFFIDATGRSGFHLDEEQPSGAITTPPRERVPALPAELCVRAADDRG